MEFNKKYFAFYLFIHFSEGREHMFISIFFGAKSASIAIKLEVSCESDFRDISSPSSNERFGHTGDTHSCESDSCDSSVLLLN